MNSHCRSRWRLSIAACLVGPVAILRGADVTFTVNAGVTTTPISKYIYGVNPGSSGGQANAGLSQSAYSGSNMTLARLGGDRWTAYNWTNNASNAGTDYQLESDSFLDSSNTPGHAVAATLTDAAAHNTAAIITIPTNGYVAADKAGPVPANVLPQNSTRFVPEFPTASADPAPASGHVYQDQFVQWVKTNYPTSLTANSTHPTYFMLDNEPDIWAGSHPEVHPAAATYAEMIQKSTDYAKAIKNVAPNAMVFGPASYGWEGYTSLQNSSDSAANNRAINPATGKAYGDFLSYYLAQMKVASTQAGTRLIDAMDVHWYPEATGLNAAGVQTRVTSADSSPGVAAARMAAPRSLWDSTYTENSWITQSTKAPIQLLNRLNGEIATNYAGTKLSMSEYNYGGGTDISGGVAEADVLGLLGKNGVYSAAEWPLQSNEKFILGAMRSYRNYDGNGGSFGDTSVGTTNSDTADTSIYASKDSTVSGKMVLIAINRTLASVSAAISLQNTGVTYSSFTVYQLTSGSAATTNGFSELPTLAGTFPIAQLANYTMPPESVSTIVLTPTPEPAVALLVLVPTIILARRSVRPRSDFPLAW